MVGTIALAKASAPPIKPWTKEPAPGIKPATETIKK
jgi:hypothetical protein